MLQEGRGRGGGGMGTITSSTRVRPPLIACNKSSHASLTLACINDFLARLSRSFARERLCVAHTDWMMPIRDPNVEVLTPPVADSSSLARAVAAAMDEASPEHAAAAAAM
jgi:hypothetical protein